MTKDSTNITDHEGLLTKNNSIETEYNQFSLNKEKFKIESNYDENVYTTSILLDQVPEHIKQKAEQIENVIIFI
jgi:PAB1-binding protein PBP1